MNEYTKFLIHIASSAAVGIALPLTVAHYFEKRSAEKHAKHMASIYAAFIAVMDDIMHGAYRDKPPGAAQTDFQFMLMTKDLKLK